MFIGTYYHTLEAKNRVSIPKAFRETTADWVVTRGLDGGLFLFPATHFFEQLSPVAQGSFTKKHTRDFLRLMTNEAQKVVPDKHGRVPLPEYLTTAAGLSKHIVITGSGNYLEIWDRDRYHTYCEELEKKAAEIAEAQELPVNKNHE